MARLLWIVMTVAFWPAAAAAASPAAVADDSGLVGARPLTVFGAASLTDALGEIGKVYRVMGHDVRFSFAASSTLARQIEAGAPAAIFASASTSWMDYLQARMLIDAHSRVSPIGNALVIIAPAESPEAEIEFNEPTWLLPLLGREGRLAIGDPDHVPAGMYARQALQTLGLWHSAQSRLALANDVRAVVALVERGEAPVGIVYATDAAISERVRVLATFNRSSHDPIRYSFALVNGPGSAEAAALMTFMSGQRALEIFRRYGFQTP